MELLSQCVNEVYKQIPACFSVPKLIWGAMVLQPLIQQYYDECKIILRLDHLFTTKIGVSILIILSLIKSSFHPPIY